MPAHHERLYPDRQPPLKESEGPYTTRDKTFYPDHSEHRTRYRRPPTTTVRPTTPRKQEGLPLPRVEPIFPDTRPPQVSSESSSSHQVMPYPYSMTEMPRAPPLEDIKMSGTNGPSRTEHTLMYPSHPTHETTPYWLYPMSERSRVPSVTSIPSSEDTRITETDWSPQTERMSTYPYIPTHETMPYPSYPTSERSRVLVAGSGSSSGDETIRESGRPLQTGNTMMYPLYATTSDGLERMPHGSIQMTYPSSSDPDIFIWSTDEPIEYPTNPSWTHEQSRRPAGENDRATSTKTPYGQDPRKMMEESSSNTNDGLISTDCAAGCDQSQTTSTMSTIHYIKPSAPELIHSPATDEVYSAPYSEQTVTVHPPLQNYQEGDWVTGVRPIETTTDKPLPECPENSAPKIRPVAALVTFIIVTILGHAIVERF